MNQVPAPVTRDRGPVSLSRGVFGVSKVEARAREITLTAQRDGRR